MEISLKSVVAFLVVIALVYIPTLIFRWHLDYSWIDALLHFLGGAWAAFLFFFLFHNMFVPEIAGHQWEKIRILILAVSFAALLGVFWEFHEFILSQYFFWYLQQSITDTMGDFLMDILGALCLSLWLLFTRKSLSR
ncbi:MAG: hypothetical protein UV58_C0001G0018 [Candidatus Wolfebacteria bacterium GW2011_GWC1_43_10]|uniref:VanZ-like domain-containing protein n=2 Tax=Candidatus Wolfeibacteriota TaxID=1752735 RepID=A0A0G1EJ95_9BACT|nr:MAG: hypothetical protein UV58_C0001G0018 [Candidatus Wolfebacteria bacterium GW2011_GWC1_43_10]KKT22717.1 MAG: hypothetical protein UW08_C0004G0013 [Parcubacteria group bacterium GW2011_GWB1_43_8b]OGM90053.1 MAG: hypothetical protein A2108_01800 [Candidatus Wolfebacteria bacterium GWA1_42_9]